MLKKGHFWAADPSSILTLAPDGWLERVPHCEARAAAAAAGESNYEWWRNQQQWVNCRCTQKPKELRWRGALHMNKKSECECVWMWVCAGLREREREREGRNCVFAQKLLAFNSSISFNGKNHRQKNQILSCSHFLSLSPPLFHSISLSLLLSFSFSFFPLLCHFLPLIISFYFLCFYKPFLSPPCLSHFYPAFQYLYFSHVYLRFIFSSIDSFLFISFLFRSLLNLLLGSSMNKALVDLIPN